MLSKFVSGVLDCNKYLLFEKQAFNELLKVIRIQNKLYSIIVTLEPNTIGLQKNVDKNGGWLDF